MRQRRGAGVSPETRLVFLTAADTRNVAEIAHIATSRPDWNAVMRTAVTHKATAALSRSFAALPPGVVDAETIEAFRKLRMVSDFHMLHLQRRLAETVRTLREASVDVMLLKGAALGASTYPAFADRPMADIDLLVRPREISIASAALTRSGWLAETDATRADMYADHHHLPPFRDARGSGHGIDLHSVPFPPPNPFESATAELWNESVVLDGQFAGARVPSREHMLLYACVHFAWSHMLERGAWRTFRDMDALIHAGVNWDVFMRSARSWKASTACYWTFRLASQLSNVHAPAEVLRALQPGARASGAGILDRHFIALSVPGEGTPCPSIRMSQAMWKLAIRPVQSGHGNTLPNAEPEGRVSVRTARSTDSLGRKLLSHVRGVGQWWKFATGADSKRYHTAQQSNS